MGRIHRRFDSPRVLPDAYVAARHDAETTRDDARREAARIVADAEARADALTRAALADAEVRATRVLTDAAQEAARMLEITEGELVALSLAVVARVVTQASAIAPELVKAEAARAVASLARARRVTLLCHADDLDALRALADESRVVVEIDPALERGDVVATSELGRTDARLRTRIENVARALGRTT